MGRPKKQPAKRADVQLAIRIPAEWMTRLRSLAVALSQPGLDLTVTDAIRMALARGMTELEAASPFQGLAPTTTDAPRRARRPRAEGDEA